MVITTLLHTKSAERTFKAGVGLRRLPDARDEWSGITTVACAGPPEAEVTRLRAAGIIASPRGGGVRLSPHFYSDEDDVARCVGALGAA